MKIDLKAIREMQEMGLIKNIINVGIKPEQVYYIKKLVEKAKFKSINQFVQQAVEEKLNKIQGGIKER